MQIFDDWLLWTNASGWLGFVGIILTLVGFAITIANVVRSRNAAERAAVAANSAVGEVRKLKVITDLSGAISELDGIRRSVRDGQWRDVSDRLSYVRKLLIGVQIQYTTISNEDLEKIKNSVLVFSGVQKDIDKSFVGKTRLSADRINRTLIDEIDSLVEIMSGMI